MNADHLVQAHRILANWRKTDADSDRVNAYSLVLLSVVPKITVAEFCERKEMMEAICKRQESRLLDVIAEFVEKGIDSADIQSILTISSELYGTLSLVTLMDQFGPPSSSASSGLPA